MSEQLKRDPTFMMPIDWRKISKLVCLPVQLTSAHSLLCSTYRSQFGLRSYIFWIPWHIEIVANHKPLYARLQVLYDKNFSVTVVWHKNKKSWTRSAWIYFLAPVSYKVLHEVTPLEEVLNLNILWWKLVDRSYLRKN